MPAPWQIYVGGSCPEHRAGWGLVVLAKLPGGRTVHAGCAYGLASGSNNSAELTAAAYAGWAALLLPGHSDVSILYDNALIAGAIDASCEFTMNHQKAGLVALIAAAARRGRKLSTYHVQGHSSNPWNELADTLAEGRHTDLPECEVELPAIPMGYHARERGALPVAHPRPRPLPARSAQ